VIKIQLSRPLRMTEGQIPCTNEFDSSEAMMLHSGCELEETKDSIRFVHTCTRRTIIKKNVTSNISIDLDYNFAFWERRASRATTANPSGLVFGIRKMLPSLSCCSSALVECDSSKRQQHHELV
jgi:hypothetical protein